MSTGPTITGNTYLVRSIRGQYHMSIVTRASLIPPPFTSPVSINSITNFQPTDIAGGSTYNNIDFYNYVFKSTGTAYTINYTCNIATTIYVLAVGGGGGGSIICTKLFELGLLDWSIYEADEAFGKMIKENNPEIYEGYIRWASIVVDWMNGSGPDIMFWIKDDVQRKNKQKEMVTKWTQRIATPWAEHMAYKMGVLEMDNKVGKFIMSVGFPICKIANVLINKNKKPNIIIGYSMWALFSVLYSISTIFKKETKQSVEVNVI